MTVQDLAKECLGYLELKERQTGDFFISRRTEAPEWFKSLCRDAHRSGSDLMLPDDTRYSFIRIALSEIATGDDIEEITSNLGADYTTQGLCAWLASHTWRMNYCDEAADEWGIEPEADLFMRMQRGQLFEMLEVFHSVVASLEAHIEEMGESA